MKKFLSAAAGLFIACQANAQAVQAVPSTSVVIDTVHYYYNKFYFKTAKPLKDFEEYKSPAATGTAISHVGVVFENDEPLDVSGIVGFLRRHPKSATSALLPIPVGLYLCTVNQNNIPNMPPIDSVKFGITGSTPSLTPVGGNLTSVRTMTSNFAILFRCMSTLEGDTIIIKRTSGHTPTATAAPELKCGDGYGLLRFNGQFFKTWDYIGPGFGYGTDYEFCLAPAVQYTLTADQVKYSNKDAGDSIFCTQERINFTNTSSSRIDSRFYNLIEFKNIWDMNPPFHPNAFPNHPLPGDKRGVAWHFLAEDNINFHLPLSLKVLEFYTDSSLKSQVDPDLDSTVCFEGNEFRVNLFSMNLKGGPLLFNHLEKFTFCIEFCGDNVGLKERGPLGTVSAYPNPSEGYLRFKGLSGEVTVDIYSLTGQKVRTTRLDANANLLDMSGLSAGTYLVRVSNGEAVRSFKINKRN